MIGADWRKIEEELIHFFSCHVDVANASGIRYLGIAATEHYFDDEDGTRPIEHDRVTHIVIPHGADHDIIDLQALAQRLARL